MIEERRHTNSVYPSVREKIRRFNMLGKVNNVLSSIPKKYPHNTHSSSSISSTSRSTTSDYLGSSNEIEQQKTSSNHTSTVTIQLQSSTYLKRSSIPTETYTKNDSRESISAPVYAVPNVIYKEHQIATDNNFDDIGLEIIESSETRCSVQVPPSLIEDYGENDIQQQSDDFCTITSVHHLPPPPPPPPPPPALALLHSHEESKHNSKRTLQLSNFLFEAGALLVVFILCMVLVLAIREEQVNLRTVMQIVYTYIYLVSTVWMIWCTFDIIKFRRQWMKLTSTVHDQEEYTNIIERHPHDRSYFPDINNTSGLFMRIGAGFFCMGSLLLTLIELGKTIETIRHVPLHREALATSSTKGVLVAKSITFIWRFLFHCVQFSFVFRYGNIVIDRYHSIAKFGLIHVVIANFCTWFEAIVIETLEQLHNHSGSTIVTNLPQSMNLTTSKPVETTTVSYVPVGTVNSLRDIAIAAQAGESTSDDSYNTTTTALEFIEKMESVMGMYLYPCLIEYSLISVTVFYIMWRNVGKTEHRSCSHFDDRHIYTVNCSRASYGLLIGGIILLLTILALIPAYILDPSAAVLVTHFTGLVLLFVALLVVCLSLFYTTTLYYDAHANVDTFDQILILVTTFGDFAYYIFWLFAAIFIESYTIHIPRGIEVTVSILAICQTFVQSGFILDTLKRRIMTKSQFRKKPGRQLITALLLINLAIWLHDSLSAKKVKLNPIQTDYYDGNTWSIVQAFTSPLSIFYRFHSSVCLADIWQEVYHDHEHHHHENIESNRRRIMNNCQH